MTTLDDEPAGRYVFTWAGCEGPQVQRFEDARSLLAYAAGWCCPTGEPTSQISVVSPREIRAS